MAFEDDFPFPKVGYVNPLEGNQDFNTLNFVAFQGSQRGLEVLSVGWGNASFWQ